MTTLTFRLEGKQREKLRHKAHLLGKTESELLRDILSRELDERPLSAVLREVRGALSLKGKGSDEWRGKIRARNWRS